ncbi:extracellular solute-binding protein [Allokutzneria sp. A3M-2-11 16]|uniref:extracellular solute-binding protein n=1 Tax=Allokutzneria sp. A3M-2-11 16 TaxID=2962043 RepID=UPI0020B888BD|nr:extracellular solute-binding protein [Allokutzneria sp. A3M-2-11 16]MCP3801190.1 extracellular solute-binding protein [Allokutzneria sp. A3M-2-11 16]
MRTAAAAVLAVAVLASGCGGPAPSSGQGTGGEPQGEISLVTPIFEGSDGQRVLEEQLAAFRKQYPKVRVRPDYTNYAKLNEKLTTSMVSGRAYDVMLLGIGWVPPFAGRLLADLGMDRAELAKTYSPRAVDAGVHDGKVYALPVMLDMRFGIYRKDLFAAAGITAPPRTFAELRDHARRLTVRDASGKLQRAGMDVLSTDPRQVYETLLWAAGGDLFTPDGKVAFNSPNAVRGLELMTDLIRTDRALDIGFTKVGDTSIPIITDRAAMALGHNNLWLEIQAQRPELIAQDKIGTFVITDERPAMFQGGTLASMSASGKNKPAALALVKFLASADASLAASSQRGNVPAVRSLESSSYVKENAFVRFAMSNMDSAFSEGGVPGWLNIRNDFKAAIESALLGQKSPKEALDELAARAATQVSGR